MNYVDMIGREFGRLTPLSRDYSKSRVSFLCRCSCGNSKVVMKQSLLSGATKSCGCIKKKYNHPRKYNRRTYRLWHTLLRRCQNPKTNGYKRYSKKNISVCVRCILLSRRCHGSIVIGTLVSLLFACTSGVAHLQLLGS